MKPVALPPGRAMLLTKPPPIGSATLLKNDRYDARHLQQRHHPGIAGRHDDVGCQCDQLASVPANFPSIAAGPPDIHLHVAALCPAQSLQRLLERNQTLLLLGIGRRIHQHADAPHPLALLRARSERPRRRRAAEQRDELATPHVGPPPPESVYCTFSLPQGGRRVL